MTNDTLERPTDGDDRSGRTEALLDELMPRQGPVWRRFLVGAVLSAVVVAGGLAWSAGLVVPRHSAWGSYGGGGQLRLDPERDALVADLYLPNLSVRDLRLTSVSLDAPGVRLVEVAVREESVDREFEVCEQDGLVEVCELDVVEGDPGPWPADLVGLPVIIPANGAVRLHLLIEPVSCQGPTTPPWGRVHGTFDFGEGAFPPLARTETVGDALVDESGGASLAGADGVTVFDVTGPAGTADLLAEACRLTGTTD